MRGRPKAGRREVGRLVILSGPSCVGKGPLCAALARFYPQLAAGLKKIVLYNSRLPRPIETEGVDYHFRARGEIEGLRGHDGYSVFEVRGDLQAVDLARLDETLERGDAFFEGNPFVASALLEMKTARPVKRISAFLSPLSADEIDSLKSQEGRVSLPDVLTDVMRRKLLRRTIRQKGGVSSGDRQDIERRAASAYRELKYAWRFDWVIPSHDGEDSENWDAFPLLLGDAREALQSFVDILEGRRPACGERWDQALVP